MQSRGATRPTGFRAMDGARGCRVAGGLGGAGGGPRPQVQLQSQRPVSCGRDRGGAVFLSSLRPIGREMSARRPTGPKPKLSAEGLWDYAVKALASRAHSTGELRRKLALKAARKE